MRLQTAAVVGVLACEAAVIFAQESRAENFSRLRAQAIERFERSAMQLESKGADTTRFIYERRLHPNVSSAFRVPDDVRVVKAAEIVFRDARNLTFTVSTNTTDIVLSEEKTTPEGKPLLMVFYTDTTLALRGAASGADINTLRAVPVDGDAAAAFRSVLSVWDQALPNILRRPQK